MSGRSKMRVLIPALAALSAVGTPLEEKPATSQRPRKRQGTPRVSTKVAVETRQIRRARLREEQLDFATARGLTRRQAKRNRARTKAESRRERREGVS